jgi:hypothetical protein
MAATLKRVARDKYESFLDWRECARNMMGWCARARARNILSLVPLRFHVRIIYERLLKSQIVFARSMILDPEVKSCRVIDTSSRSEGKVTRILMIKRFQSFTYSHVC